MSQGHRLPRAVRHVLLLCREGGSVGAPQPCTTIGSLPGTWWGAAHSLTPAAVAVRFLPLESCVQSMLLNLVSILVLLFRAAAKAEAA